MTQTEALRLALEALEYAGPSWIEARQPAITAIKEALANEALDKMAENARELGLDYEPEQPKIRTGNCLRVGVCASEGHKIQPQRKPLTDEEIQDALLGYRLVDAIDIARAIESAHGIKG